MLRVRRSGLPAGTSIRDDVGITGVIPDARLNPPARHRQPVRIIRMAAVLVSTAALTSAAVGVTSAIFKSTVSGAANSITAGTVTLTDGSATGTCSSSGILPDGTARTCSVQATYQGGATTWMGLDVFIATKPGSGGAAENLYNPGASDHPGTFAVTDNQSSPVTYSLPTTSLGSCPNAASSINGTDYSSYNKCYLSTTLLVSKSTLSAGASVTFTVSITVPTNNGTNYQSGSAVVIVRPRVAQSANNGSTSSCTPGTTCPGVTTWS